MATGGLMQLVAYGQQDIFLTNNDSTSTSRKIQFRLELRKQRVKILKKWYYNTFCKTLRSIIYNSLIEEIIIDDLWQQLCNEEKETETETEISKIVSTQYYSYLTIRSGIYGLNAT